MAEHPADLWHQTIPKTHTSQSKIKKNKKKKSVNIQHTMGSKKKSPPKISLKKPSNAKIKPRRKEQEEDSGFRPVKAKEEQQHANLANRKKENNGRSCQEPPPPIKQKSQRHRRKKVGKVWQAQH